MALFWFCVLPCALFGVLSFCVIEVRNWPIRFSSTNADWVNLISSPCLRDLSSPPGSSPTYCSPSKPAVRILAVESSGILAWSPEISRVATAWKVVGSMLMPRTRPMRTPAILTEAPLDRLPMVSNLAVTW